MLVAAAALAGCERETIVAGPNVHDEETNSAANAGVTLPPSIAATKTYRCADNSVINIDWLSDQKSANIRTDQNASPTHVAATEAGQPMAGPGGVALTGTAAAPTVSVTFPGQAAKTCRHG